MDSAFCFHSQPATSCRRCSSGTYAHPCALCHQTDAHTAVTRKRTLQDRTRNPVRHRPALFNAAPRKQVIKEKGNREAERKLSAAGNIYRLYLSIRKLTLDKYIYNIYIMYIYKKITLFTRKEISQKGK